MTQSRLVQIERDILAKNDGAAARNRRLLAQRGIFALNLVSSPVLARPTLLVRTIELLAGRLPVTVIEGDQQTSVDADRIRATGGARDPDQHRQGLPPGRRDGPQRTRTPGAASQLGADDRERRQPGLPGGFDLGEAHKVVVLSVTEGEDKPLKYPDMFYAAQLMLLNKGRPAALPCASTSNAASERAAHQPGDRDRAALGHHRPRHGRVAGLDRTRRREGALAGELSPMLTEAPTTSAAAAVRVRGTVQGVGFRPFVHAWPPSWRCAAGCSTTPKA